MGDGTSSFFLRLYLQWKGETKLSKYQQIDVVNIKNVQNMVHVPSPWILKGKKLGTYGLEGIKGSSAEPSEVGLNFDTWLGMLNPTS